MRYTRHPRTASRVIDGRAVIVSIDANRVFTLNAQATRVWEGLQSGRTIDELAADLCRGYAVTEAVARADCERFFGALEARGLIVAAP
jgi:hypothetical protein